MVWGCFYSIFAPGRCVLSYPNDALSDDIDALISGANALSAAADSVGTISGGSDVLVSNFDHVEEVFDNLQAFLSELKSGHFYTPVGALMPFAGTSAYVPSGWLLCDGAGYATSGTYADLFSVIGTTYGSSGGFQVPDLQGRVAIGLGTNGDVGAVGNNEGIALANVANRSPKHKHSISSLSVAGGGAHTPTGTIGNAGAHSHTIDAIRENIGRASGGSTFYKLDNGGSQGTSGVGDHAHGLTMNGVGDHVHSLSGTVGVGSGTNDTMPYLTLNYIIKF